jgi:pyrimidine deaminase RibD-like protein/predicted GNAT family acetyltransferase
VIINEILTAQSNPQEELDAILAKCCELVLDGQASDPDFYGLVGACVVFPNGNKVYGVSYHDNTTGKVVHAERAALDRCDTVDADCVVVTTLSPCNERHDKTAKERYGESCEELIANSGIQRVYCGYKDFTQDHSDSTVTENPQLQELCKRLSDTFLKEDTTEDFEGLAFKIKQLDSANSEHAGFVLTALDPTWGKELGYVVFADMDNNELDPRDLYVDERYRGQGIAKIMYDYAKSLGYTIHRSPDQTDAGRGFWDKHKGPESNVWENFADGKKPGRKGLAKRSGVNTKASISSLRKTAKNSSGEKARMAHWLANMKAGRAKKK